ncbi:MAG: endolytic transglycosylase MltG [Bacteroidales bacterium]|nr:endolytic transglycosylase MltG [Bacteroidales bacterium]
MAYYYSKYRKDSSKNKSKLRRYLLIILFLVIIVACVIGYRLFVTIYKSNVWIPEQETTFVYIPTNSNFEDVKKILYSNGIIINRGTFEWLAEKKNLPNSIKPGKYLIRNGMSNDELINLLRSGVQEPVRLIFNSERNLNRLVRTFSKQIEPDSSDLINLLNDSVYVSKFGFTPDNVSMLFIPNTYHIFWDISAEQFLERMNNEYKRFWNDKRKSLCDSLNMTIAEVVTLASIVEKETAKNDEKPIIAGVYINRLKKKWYLQADPTLIFAHNDYTIKRVLNKHKSIDSPYNTYTNKGLPPGPICLPSISSIDAVLNFDKHNYFYFCAKDDLSGYHSFAKSNAQHNQNAREYRKALDNLNIRK